MTKVLKSPARINRRSQYAQTSGYNWDLGKVAFTDNLELVDRDKQREQWRKEHEIRKARKQ